jgi:tripartite-type tricarboxylate transporter receptor subunit TctC
VRKAAAINRGWSAILVGLALAAFVAVAPSRAADDYPQRAVKIIVPYPPGGSADVLRLGIAWGIGLY